jgi:arylsulfatase A-like enzyme
VFYGAEIQPQNITEKYNAVDLVPTLSDLIQIPRPDKSLGVTITQVLDKR